MDKSASTTISGGAYIPPAKLRQLQASITDKKSVEYQRLSWEALKKSINGLVNKVNIPNIAQIVRELFKENIIRGRGVLVKGIIQAQQFSPTFTNTYAALVAIINTKFPQIGELTLTRLIFQFKTSYRQNKKDQCLACCRFIAHLINQNVAHEILALQILTLLLENPTNHSVELAMGLLKECGKKLMQESPRSLHAIFETLRNILHQSEVDQRIQYMIEVMFAIRKDEFKDYPIVVKELDLVEEDDQFTHMLALDEENIDPENQLNIFKHDLNYEEGEEKYKILKKEILDESDSDDDEGNGGSDSDDDDDDDEEDEDAKKEEEEDNKLKEQIIIDQTETNLVSLRRTIYLTIQSSLDFQECAHKLLKMELKKSQESELCQMILDSCAQQRTFEKFFGLLAQRFCQLRKEFVEYFENIFREQYETVHRLETVKLRNVSKLFSHLFYTDSISWGILECIHLNEDETTSSSRVFIKNLFIDLSENMGIMKMKERLNDVTLQEFFQGIFPRDNPRNTRFSINFFTSIGLGALTEALREHLKSAPKIIPATILATEENNSQDGSIGGQVKIKKEKPDEIKKKKKKKDSSSSSSSSSSSDSSSSSSSSETSSSSDSDSDDATDRKKKKKTSKKRKEKALKRKEYSDIDDNKDRNKKHKPKETVNKRDSSREEKRRFKADKDDKPSKRKNYNSSGDDSDRGDKRVKKSSSSSYRDERSSKSRSYREKERK